MSIKAVENEIENAASLKVLVETYKLMAANSMRRIRSSVLENRAFHLGLNDVYQEVKRSYEIIISAEARKKNKPKRTPLVAGKTAKSVYALISANTGLYGEVISKTFSLFAEAVRNDKPDEVVVIGKVGEAFFRETMPGRKFSYFDFPDTQISLEGLRAVAGHLKKFDRAVVFHGVFKSFLSQVAVSSPISGEVLEKTTQAAERVRYIYEPTLEVVAAFFETEIFVSLLEQIFHESRLSKLASRMMLLDRSGQTIDGFVKKLFLQQQRIRHRIFNNKQMDTVRGI